MSQQQQQMRYTRTESDIEAQFKPQINLGNEGFGPGLVPPEEFYISRYSRRGNTLPNGERTPVWTSTRWGNPQFIGKDMGYVGNQANPDYLRGYKQKKGMQGVFETVQYGVPVAEGFGILAEMRNTAISTKGGPMRRGAGKRAAYYDRETGEEVLFAGQARGPYLETNRNNTMRWEPKRKQPTIIDDRSMDPIAQTVLQQNAWFIPSYNHIQAMQMAKDELDGLEINTPNGEMASFMHGPHLNTGMTLEQWDEFVDDTSLMQMQ